MKLINVNKIKTTPKKLGVVFKIVVILLEFQKKKRGSGEFRAENAKNHGRNTQ